MHLVQVKYLFNEKYKIHPLPAQKKGWKKRGGKKGE